MSSVWLTLSGHKLKWVLGVRTVARSIFTGRIGSHCTDYSTQQGGSSRVYLASLALVRYLALTHGASVHTSRDACLAHHSGIGRTAWLRTRALEAHLCRRTLWIRVELLDPLIHAGGQPSALVQPVHTEQLTSLAMLWYRKNLFCAIVLFGLSSNGALCQSSHEVCSSASCFPST